MRTFWIWLILLFAIWLCALQQLAPEGSMVSWSILGSALFFAAFFISPLLRQKPAFLCLNLTVASLLAVFVLWPGKEDNFNPYTLLILSVLAGKAAYRLPPIHATILGLICAAGALAPYAMGYPSLPPAYIGLYAVLLAIGFAVFRNASQRAIAAEARNEALLGEYRKLKRRMASDEELARREERAQVGRDIHDSVGHKLTALMMQLEVFRMQRDVDPEGQIIKLKELAQESLYETRSAVKVLKDSEPGGLSAIMRLIRKLEAESVIKVHFTVKHGALSAPLNNDQSIAVYRAVQEALTNIMKHSKSREADIMFEAPGGSVFRFEITNPGGVQGNFREGFGLSSMRERIGNVMGRLEILDNRDRFTVRGTIPLIIPTSYEETSG
ncbi:sensor histidine kinase [Fontibacillus sp. BL9]|uniref:sensor histidine kinase n=1 Tax=Fontibacillus sp. BL9 TaxID=3389971 RepID=UPI003979157A